MSESQTNVERFDAEGAFPQHLSEVSADGIRQARLNQVASQIREWAARSWSYEDAPNLVVYSLLELAYSFPKRADDLIASIRLLAVGNRVVPAVILARALVETVAMGRYYVETIERHLQARDFQKLESIFLRFFMGSRIDGSPVKSIHVNDALRDLEQRDLAYLAHLVGQFPASWSSIPDPVATFEANSSLQKTYDRLSEISHPNGLGTQFLYPADDAPDNQKTIAHYRFMTDLAVWQAHHLVVGLRKFDDFAERFVAAFPGQTAFSDAVTGISAKA